MEKYKLIAKLLVLVVLVLAGLRVVVSNVISTSGVELGKINEEISVLRLQNDSLSEKFFSEASLTTIASQAAKLGFTNHKENFVLTNPLPIAAKQ
ncbi:MAG TPA: hypothetical protein VKC89_01485 [Patescibacteria group bacterium]|nr:hypothetical protein [Patescibacteria group bacterium]